MTLGTVYVVILVIIHSIFFLVHLKFYEFVDLYKKLSLNFIDLSFFGPYLFHYDLCDCLSLPNFGLIFLFLVPLGVELDGLFEITCFLHKCIYWCKSPLRAASAASQYFCSVLFSLSRVLDVFYFPYNFLNKEMNKAAGSSECVV